MADRTRIGRVPAFPHVKQQGNWDCGVACSAMVLSGLLNLASAAEADHDQPGAVVDNGSLAVVDDHHDPEAPSPAASEPLLGAVAGRENLEVAVTLDDMYQAVGTTSTWTIDIAFLLFDRGVDFVYTTTSLGVRPEYADQNFYAGTFSDDEARVGRLFTMAMERHMRIEERSVDDEELIAHLEAGNVAIALVNSRLLCCDECPGANVKKAAQGLICCIDAVFSSSSYTGHYVVLCGYDPASGEEGAFVYLDPATKGRVCTAAVDNFGDARRSFGTDEDLLLVDVAASDVML